MTENQTPTPATLRAPEAAATPDIAVLRELESQATPAPWSEPNVFRRVKANLVAMSGNHAADSRLITAVRDALPSLLDAADRLAAAEQELRGVREQNEQLAAELRRRNQHPIVRAVADLVDEVERQHHRAESAHDQKDQANQRWLDAVTAKPEEPTNV